MADPTLSKKRYVPLVEAAKISGYTREYVERLCRIGKIPCRSMGEKTIVELDALLSQTGTILLGDEHVGFIEVDDSSPYPLLVPSVETQAPQNAGGEEQRSRPGRVAVVGEMFHADDTEKTLQERATIAQREKFPSNALPFFSSVGKSGTRSGVHIAISREGTSPTRIPSMDRQPIHLSIQGSSGPEKVEESSPRTSNIKAVSVMPRELPANFVPTIPVSGPSLAPAPLAPRPMAQYTAPHDHDLERYVSKLPMIAAPTSLVGKAVLAVFAFGLLVLPTALGVGHVLDETMKDFAGSLRSGARTSMAAVGLIDPNKDVSLFPYLEATSRILAATGASTAGTQNGIVVTPSTGNPMTDQQIKDVIQKTFSSPVSVIPDAKDAKTGLIKPTFQKSSGTNYIYVMVPFRN